VQDFRDGFRFWHAPNHENGCSNTDSNQKTKNQDKAHGGFYAHPSTRRQPSSTYPIAEIRLAIEASRAVSLHSVSPINSGNEIVAPTGREKVAALRLWAAL
jgi:hypothetical protein